MSKVKKIRSGKYEYKDWYIVNIGYYNPEGRICWEGVNKKTGYCDYNAYTKGDIIQQIDSDLNDDAINNSK